MLQLVNRAEACRQISITDEDMFPFPDMSDPSTLMSEEHILKMIKNLPARAEGYSWTLVYSSDKNGFSLKTLYRSMCDIDSPILLVIKETRNQVTVSVLLTFYL